jgi:hypothetical protein
MSKLYDAEILLDEKMDIISEEFSATLTIARIRGQKNIDWTDCYDSRCVNVDKYERDLCKEACHMQAVDKALARIITLRGQCAEASNPKMCVKSVNASVESFRKKRTQIRNRISKITRKVAAYRRRTGGK